MWFICIITSVVGLLAVLEPLLRDSGEKLDASTAENNPELLDRTLERIVTRYLRDEKAYERKDISERQWRARQDFLAKRYVDFARRLYFVRSENSQHASLKDPV